MEIKDKRRRKLKQLARINRAKTNGGGVDFLDIITLWWHLDLWGTFSYEEVDFYQDESITGVDPDASRELAIPVVEEVDVEGFDNGSEVGYFEKKGMPERSK